jgi:PAS domain S-box-containing protein
MNDPAHPSRPVFDLLDATATAAVAVDDTGVIRYANARAFEVFGYGRDELLGQPIELLVPQDRAAGHVAQRDGYLRAPTSRSLDARRDLKGRRKNGTEFNVEISLTPLETASGPWVVASVLDVSLRRGAEARVRQQSRNYLAMAKLNEAAAAAEDAASLFERVCHVAVVHGGFMGAWVAVPGLDDDSVHITASAGPLATNAAVASSRTGGLDEFISEQLRELRRSGVREPGPVSELISDEPWFDVDGDDPAESFGIRGSATLPLRSRGLAVASLSLYSDTAGTFDDSLREMLVRAAENISLALDRFQANADLDRALSQRTELLRRLVNVQERERARIAADVHDEPVQALAAVDLRLALLERQLAEAAPHLVPDVVRIHETILSVNDGLRDLLFELEPVAASAHLTDLIEDAATHIFELAHVDWKIENAPDPAELDLSVATRTQAVRIAKEALVNVAKHAQAHKVSIRVTLDDDGVTVEVADDGVGLPPGVRSSPPGHRGISGMLDRAEISGGSLSVDSDATGTTVSVWLPRV